jgi:hypothetical protein
VVGATPDALMWDAKDLLQRQIVHPLMQATDCVVHAAAVVVRKRVALLLGPKGSGKTRLQLQLASSGAGLVASDRVYLGREPSGQIRALGYPARMSLHHGAFQRFPRLGTWKGLPADGPKAMLSLAEVARRFGTRVEPGGLVGLILTPSTSVDEHVAPIPRRQLVSLLRSEWLDSNDPMVVPWLGLVDSDPRRARRNWNALLRTLPSSMVAARVGVDYALSRSPSALVDEIESVVGRWD